MDKIIVAEYDEETGISTVSIGTPWGVFTESVIRHEDDKDVANRWDGCRFANYKCIADKYAAKGRAFLERAKGIEHAMNVWLGTGRATDYTMLKMFRRQAEIAAREGHRCITVANKMREDYNDYVEEVLSNRRKFRDKKENSND